MNDETEQILRQAKAGISDKGDVVVQVEPSEAGSGINLDIKSKVMAMFGKQIRASVLEVIESYNLADLNVSIEDQGALDFAIRARVQTALERATIHPNIPA